MFTQILCKSKKLICAKNVCLSTAKKLSMSSGLQRFPKVLHNRTTLGQHREGICCIEYLFALNQIEIPFWIRIYQDSQTTKARHVMLSRKCHTPWIACVFRGNEKMFASGILLATSSSLYSGMCGPLCAPHCGLTSEATVGEVFRRELGRTVLHCAVPETNCANATVLYVLCATVILTLQWAFQRRVCAFICACVCNKCWSGSV